MTLATIAFVLSTARSASADFTAFLGVTPTPANHALRGFALGFSLLIIGFEFEYARAVENEDEGLPGLLTGSGNILVQTPVEIAGMKFYATMGGGLYRERLASRQETHFGTNFGGGAKIRLAGPLGLRLDYRVLRLQGEPLHQTYQRFYAGANLSF
jgi:hypothetical protein